MHNKERGENAREKGNKYHHANVCVLKGIVPEPDGKEGNETWRRGTCVRQKKTMQAELGRWTAKELK